MEKIRIVTARPGMLPEVSFITDSLRGMQETVGGCIELFESTESGIDYFCNEEGKLLSLPPNRYLPERGDIICGTILAIGADPEGASVSLTDEQVAEAVDRFTRVNPPMLFFRAGDAVFMVPVS